MRIQYYKSKRSKIHKSVYNNNDDFTFYCWYDGHWHNYGTGNGKWLASQGCTLDHLKKITETEAFIELL